MSEIDIDNLAFNLKPEEWFNQRPHHNLFNKFFYSNLWKTIYPFHETRDFSVLERQRSAEWYGSAPQGTWVDGVIDYTYNKHNVNSIGHFHMHENRKNKPNKSREIGGDKTHFLLTHPTFKPIIFPKGCNREIIKYQKCIEEGGKNCTEQKINIVEICPKWCLEKLREFKKFYMKAAVIDNNTYRRAMKVEDYNKDRSLADLTNKNAHLRKIRRDGYWSDDRYNPIVYPSPDQNTNIVFGDEIIYSDIIGGNRIAKITKERENAMNSL